MFGEGRRRIRKSGWRRNVPSRGCTGCCRLTRLGWRHPVLGVDARGAGRNGDYDRDCDYGRGRGWGYAPDRPSKVNPRQVDTDLHPSWGSIIACLGSPDRSTASEGRNGIGADDPIGTGSDQVSSRTVPRNLFVPARPCCYRCSSLQRHKDGKRPLPVHPQSEHVHHHPTVDTLFPTPTFDYVD